MWLLPWLDSCVCCQCSPSLAIHDDAVSAFPKSKLQPLFYEKMNRKERQILSQLLQVKGLIPLLMKPRNNQQWTPQDKRELILKLCPPLRDDATNEQRRKDH